MLVIAANAGQETDSLRAIAAEYQNEGTAFHGDFRARLQIV